jgi:hypothetical protein
VERGDEVHALQCASSLAACEPSPRHERIECLRCRSKSDRGLALAGIPRNRRHELSPPQLSGAEFPRFHTLSRLIAYERDGLPVGRAVASSLVGISRDTSPDMDRYADLVRRLILTYLDTYRGVRAVLTQLSPDVFYVYNARFAPQAAGYRAARDLGVRTVVHDRAALSSRYLLCENSRPFDLDAQKGELRRHAQLMEADAEGEAAARRWFADNRQAHTLAGASAQLPAGFNSRRRNIAIFNSPDNELYTLEEWCNRLYPDQTTALRTILEASWPDEFHFYLRVHPALRGLENTQVRATRRLADHHVTVIPPEMGIDPYALVEACEKTLSFGSTVGIEAAYWNRPSLVAGRCFHEDLEACYLPRSHAELVDQLQRALPARSPLAALPFGYWMGKRGHAHRFYEPSAPDGACFKGEEMKPYLRHRILLRLADGLGRKASGAK